MDVIVARVAPLSDTTWTERACPDPIETETLELDLPALGTDRGSIVMVRSAHPSERLLSTLLKLLPAISLSMARSAAGSAVPQRRKAASVGLDERGPTVGPGLVASAGGALSAAAGVSGGQGAPCWAVVTSPVVTCTSSSFAVV